jgi:DNA-binding transcriptional MerR regulator
MPTELRRPERSFTIRQLCLEFKCTPRALRFYEDKGLLAPARQGLNRVYSYKDRARLQLILRQAGEPVAGRDPRDPRPL